ncbi:MAG: hypothetical protein QCI00_07395 [Candidatus Thermoplasmatota archaeon]|nr:hypothetical protein [Candidatus Thermoplasmatota archaeon]
MINKNRAVKIIFIFEVFIIIFACIPSSNVNADDNKSTLREKTGLISFNQYITLDFDKDKLNTPLTIDEPVTVPITVSYSHDVPDNFLKFIKNSFPLIYNKVIFGSMMAPQQQIRLTISENPDWADIYIDNPIIDIKIPTTGSEKEYQTVTLVIVPYREAPSQPKSISILGECNAVGSLKPHAKEHTLSFTPVYIPRIDVMCDTPIRQVGPRETVDFKITIKNNGNKNTIIKISYNASQSWAPIVSPSDLLIKPNGQEIVTFSVTAPYDFGWHDYPTSMKIFCQPYPDPLPIKNLSDFKIAEISQDIKIFNYGFSFAGAEFIFILLLIIVCIIIVYYYKKK